MRYFGGMTAQEIADAMGISTATIGREIRVALEGAVCDRLDAHVAEPATAHARGETAGTIRRRPPVVPPAQGADCPR